ncbi:major facilitator superfamily domain-containing protein [Trichoderma velutinum]
MTPQDASKGSITRSDFHHELEDIKSDARSLVNFDGPDDVYNPLNWPFSKKMKNTLLYGFTTMGSTWASSIYSTTVPSMSRTFHVSNEVSILGLTLFLIGFGLGPLIWAPVSELYGRKISILPPYIIAACFVFGTAAAKDFQTIMITRFFTGLFGSAPVTNTGGVMADLWLPRRRAVAMAGYAFAVAGGPLVAPVVGGAIDQSYLGWRWIHYITGILICFIFLVDIVFIDETFAPVLLVHKARRLRLQSGNWALHTTHEEWDPSLGQFAQKFLSLPFQMLFDPIGFLFSVYAAFVFGIVYLCERHWNEVQGGLPFLSIILGTIIGSVINISNQKFYIKKLQANNGVPVPEARLPPVIFGAVVFAAGNFIFGWTSNKQIHWIGEMIGAASIGIGFFSIFQGSINYMVDTFTKYSASAVAAMTFLRCILAGILPLIAGPMYHNLGINWASSLIGFVATGMIPIPILCVTLSFRVVSHYLGCDYLTF